MPGPILRKYGFPNFAKIFGERPLEHGTDEPEVGEGEAKKPNTVKSSAGNSAAETTKTTESKSRESLL
jgi:hypothetical protein